MDAPTSAEQRPDVGEITVRYWASARAAAGVAAEQVPVPGPVTLAELRRLAVAGHPGSRLETVLAVCSVIVGEQPVGTRDAEEVVVAPGEAVEFLPPFAGGAGLGPAPAL